MLDIDILRIDSINEIYGCPHCPERLIFEGLGVQKTHKRPTG